MNVVGQWQLQSWSKLSETGDAVPWSQSPLEGFLVYSQDGMMAVNIYEAKSAKIATSYSGQYEQQDGWLIHYPNSGVSPNGISQPKKRKYIFHEGQLILFSPKIEDEGTTYQHQLIWVAIP